MYLASFFYIPFVPMAINSFFQDVALANSFHISGRHVIGLKFATSPTFPLSFTTNTVLPAKIGAAAAAAAAVVVVVVVVRRLAFSNLVAFKFRVFNL